MIILDFNIAAIMIVSMLLITTVVQKPEETINPVFGVRSSFAYTTDMKKAFYVHKPMRIIMVKIVNYTALLGILGNDSCNLTYRKRPKSCICLNPHI